MTIDNKEIKKALDSFEEDDFIKSKDIIKAQVKGAISDYFKDRLELQNDLESSPAPEKTEPPSDADTKVEDPE